MLKPFCLTFKNWCKDTHILLKSLYLVFGSYYLYRRFLSNSFNDLFIRSIRQDFFQMLENPLIRFLGSAVALASLLGATGNHPAYAPLLKAMGAADERDDVFASVCYCPITDLDHADMAYEWLYGNTESRKSLSASKQALSQELAAQFPSYINSLGLKKADGTALDADNYLDYIKQILIKSAQEAKDAGADIPDSLGFSFSSMAAFQAPVNGQSSKRHRPGMGDKKPQRHCLFRLHQSGYQTAEHGQGRWLQASLEQSSQRRLCLERTVCLVSRNLIKRIESISIVVNT